MKNVYEPGMKITYDPVSRRVVVSFRGRITVLPVFCRTEAEAIVAGEAHCRTQGWVPTTQSGKANAFRSLW